MLKLEKGRPADCAGRLGKEVRTYDCTIFWTN